MSLPPAIASRWSSDSHGHLLVGGQSISEIATKYGTPFYIYDQSSLANRFLALREALPANFTISYSVKANPNPAFLRFFMENGCGLEIASAGEFYLARHAGCPSNDIVFAGPGKTEAELEYVIANGIGEIHVESALEIARISHIGKKFGRRVPIAVRVNPDENGQGGAMRMGGKSAPFGIDEERLEPILHRIVPDKHLEFTGLHLFVGTQILDAEILLSQYRKGLEIAQLITKITLLPLRTLDFGGGLGVPYFPGDNEIDLKTLRLGLLEMMAVIGEDPAFASTRFMVEPGRFLVGESGIYVTRVTDIKMSRDKKYLIVDGGMHQHLAASGNLGQVVRRNFPMAVLNRLSEDSKESVDVVGPLCTPLDTIGRSVLLPQVQIGDLLGVFQSGAYARSASPLGFLSHETPPEIWMGNGCDFLIRQRGSFEQLTQDVCELPSLTQSARRSASVASSHRSESQVNTM